MKIFLVATSLFLFIHSGIYSQSLPDTLQIDEVVVTASRIEISKRNVPITISTISRQEIELSNESQVLPLISHRVPGMFVTERGVTGFGVASGSAGQISMRGVGGTAPNTQVLLLIDGQPQFQGLFGHPLPDAYVSSDVERVEVIRGPASILYGSNALAGAINLITRRQVQEGYSGNARVSYGSFNTQKYMANGGFRQDRFSIFASVNHDRTDGHRDNSEFSIVNGFVKAGYELNPNFSLTADFNLADFTSDDPGPINNEALFGIDIQRGRASLALKNSFDNLEGALTGFWNFGKHEFTNGWISEDYHAGISLFQGFGLFQGNRVTMGADMKRVAGVANSGVPGAADVWHEVDDGALYALMQQNLSPDLIVSGGLRLEISSVFGTELVPQAGFSYNVNGSFTLTGSFSKGFRSPTIVDLYLFAPNPDLVPERLWNYEAGFNYLSPSRAFNAALTLFILEGENFIQVVPNPAGPPPMIRQNVGEFTNSGIELEMSWRPSSMWQVSGNYSYINMDNPRLASPEHQLFAEGTFTQRGLRVNLSAQHISGLYTRIGDDPLQESYTLVNLRSGYRINPMIEIFLAGRNLLDQEYTINFGYPMPGIHFMSGINFSF